MLLLTLFVGCSTDNSLNSSADQDQQDLLTPSDKASRIDDFLTEQVAKGFAGVALVHIDGETILHEAYPSEESSITKDSCFWVASISKMFTAATAVLLQEQGLLNLQAPISTYLDAVPADKQDITMHHLLTHTSGMDSNYVAEGITDREQAIRKILTTPLDRPIGDSYLYSGDGYNLAAIIIEVVSGKPFERVIENKILSPMGLTNMGFWGYPLDGATCNLVPYKTAAGISDSVSRPNYGFRGATGLRSNAVDLLRWYQSLFEGNAISAEARQLIFTPYVEKRPGVSYGYGWNIVETSENTRMLAHTGQDDMITHVTYLYAFPNEDIVLILFTTSSVAIGTETLRGMRRIVLSQ